MEIIIEGHKIDTKDIWDVEIIKGGRSVSVTIKLTDKPPIILSRDIPYETYSSEYSGIYAPYEKLYKAVREKWEADKSDIPVFKL